MFIALFISLSISISISLSLSLSVSSRSNRNLGIRFFLGEDEAGEGERGGEGTPVRIGSPSAANNILLHHSWPNSVTRLAHSIVAAGFTYCKDSVFFRDRKSLSSVGPVLASFNCKKGIYISLINGLPEEYVSPL